jgi:hypothetical protein
MRSKFIAIVVMFTKKTTISFSYNGQGKFRFPTLAGGDTDLGFGDDTGGADAGGDFGSATGDTGEFDTKA